MIKEAIDRILAIKEGEIHKTESDGREFFCEHGKFTEKMPVVESALFAVGDGKAPLMLRTVSALCDLIEAYGDSTSNQKGEIDCRIVVSRSNISALFGATQRRRSDQIEIRDEARVCLSYLDGIRLENDYDGFIDLLNYHSGNILDEGPLREALTMLKVKSIHELSIKDSGGFTVISETASKGVEGATKKLPQAITIVMPYGTTEFLYPVAFSFRLKIDQSRPMFMLQPKPDHHLRQMFFKDVTEVIRGRFPDGDGKVVILEGA